MQRQILYGQQSMNIQQQYQQYNSTYHQTNPFQPCQAVHHNPNVIQSNYNRAGCAVLAGQTSNVIIYEHPPMQEIQPMVSNPLPALEPEKEASNTSSNSNASSNTSKCSQQSEKDPDNVCKNKLKNT